MFIIIIPDNLYSFVFPISRYIKVPRPYIKVGTPPTVLHLLCN